MKNKIIRNIVIGFVVVASVALVVSSTFIWHQPKAPECVA
jgi:cyclic lactone autoinducer peptide